MCMYTHCYSVVMSRVLSQEQLLQSVADTGDTIKPLANAAKGEAEKLGHQVAMTSQFSIRVFFYVVAPQILE